MSDSPENDFNLLSPDDINMQIDSAIKILPVKSKEKYEAVYQHFTAWQASKKLTTFSESVLLIYFNELIGKVKPPTLWARYSMLKSTIKMNNNIDIRSYTQLSAILRKASKGYKSAKPKILSSEEILEFLTKAPDHNYLATKVAVVFGICGALKKGELCELRTSHISDFNTHLVVKVPNNETKSERVFFVHGDLFYNLYKSYAALRPHNIATSRFFLNYNYGKCTQQVIGINKFGSMPKQVAKYLNLPNFECYTGHSIRRTSASLLSDLGAVPAPKPTKLIKIQAKPNLENPPPLSQVRIEKQNFVISTTNNGEETSTTKNGWIDRFKQQYGRIKISDRGAENSENTKVSKVSIHYENLSLDNLYNADEAIIPWRPLENSNDDKMSDSVSALFCSNATGSHRIPLMTVGNAEEPECFHQLMSPELRSSRLKFFKKFNVVYTHENRSGMDKHIFLLWYKEIFIPNVTEYQKKSGTTAKVILMIDNAPCHPSLSELNAVNKNFQVLPLPSKITAANQPMNQGLISLTKKHYKNNLLKQALLSRQGAENYIKKFNLSDCFQLLGEAWDNLDSAALKKVWKTFLAESSANPQNSSTENESSVVEESTSFLQNKGDQLSQLLTESNWSTHEIKDRFLNWFNEEEPTKNDNSRNCQEPRTEKIETTDVNELKRNYMEMKNDFIELRKEFTELRSKFIEIKDELSENRTRKVTVETLEDSMNFEDNEFLPIKDEMEEGDEDNEEDDNEDDDVENIEIEESKSFIDGAEKTSIADAFTHYNEFRTWMKVSNLFVSKHFKHLDDIESIMRKEM